MFLRHVPYVIFGHTQSTMKIQCHLKFNTVVYFKMPKYYHVTPSLYHDITKKYYCKGINRVIIHYYINVTW